MNEALTLQVIADVSAEVLEVLKRMEIRIIALEEAYRRAVYPGALPPNSAYFVPDSAYFVPDSAPFSPQIIKMSE